MPPRLLPPVFRPLGGGSEETFQPGSAAPTWIPPPGFRFRPHGKVPRGGGLGPPASTLAQIKSALPDTVPQTRRRRGKRPGDSYTPPRGPPAAGRRPMAFPLLNRFKICERAKQAKLHGKSLKLGNSLLEIRTSWMSVRFRNLASLLKGDGFKLEPTSRSGSTPPPHRTAPSPADRCPVGVIHAPHGQLQDAGAAEDRDDGRPRAQGRAGGALIA